MSSHSLISVARFKNYITARLHGHITNQKKFALWLDELEKTAFGQVLIVSLYIDLNNNSLDEVKVADVIDRLELSDGDPRAAFCQCIEEENLQSKYLFSHKGGPQRLLDDQYVRVIPLKAMIEYYLRAPLLLSSVSYEAEREVMDKFLTPSKDEREKLSIVKVIWRGLMKNVWVTSKKELDAALSYASIDDVRDRLGLYGLNDGKLVCIIYPMKRNYPTAYIPTTLDIHTHCLFYISHASNQSWGMTCGLKLSSEGLKERVHESIEGLTDEFEMELLGEVKEKAEPNITHLLQEAIRRAP